MVFSIKNEYLTATITSFGAELISLKNTTREYIWEGNPQFWAKHTPVLFPIVGTLKNSCYLYNDIKYELPRHGFARDCKFEVIAKSETEIVFSLKADEVSIKKYPFIFELQLHYILLNNDLQVKYKIINHDAKPMPFSIGAHPAFALPKKFDDYALKFEKQETLKSFTLEDDLLSDNFFEIAFQDKILALDYTLFANDALIFKNINSKKITILENDLPLLSIAYPDFKNLGIWTKTNAPFICLEPWLGYSDSSKHNQNILEKEGIQIVSENCTFDCFLTISIL